MLLLPPTLSQPRHVPISATALRGLGLPEALANAMTEDVSKTRHNGDRVCLCSYTVAQMCFAYRLSYC